MERPLTETKITGTGTLTCENGIIGGVLISTDNSNAAAVTIQKDGSKGEMVFDISTKTAMYVRCQIPAATTIYYSISGTGASAQIFEYVS